MKFKTSFFALYPISWKLKMSDPIRLATFDDLDGVMEVIHAVVPIMNAAGNFQWNESYPTEAHFTVDIDHEDLW